MRRGLLLCPPLNIWIFTHLRLLVCDLPSLPCTARAGRVLTRLSRNTSPAPVFWIDTRHNAVVELRERLISHEIHLGPAPTMPELRGFSAGGSRPALRLLSECAKENPATGGGVIRSYQILRLEGSRLAMKGKYPLSYFLNASSTIFPELSWYGSAPEGLIGRFVEATAFEFLS